MTLPMMTAAAIPPARPVSECIRPRIRSRAPVGSPVVAMSARVTLARGFRYGWTRRYPFLPVQEKALTERLITYDTSTVEGIQSAAGFVKGWLEARDVDVKAATNNGLPVLAATVGSDCGPTLVLHGHLDVVPGHPEQFEPRVDGDRLCGRGAYDMKGGLAAMMCATVELAAQRAVRVHFLCVPDEESDEPFDRGSD